MKKNLLGLVLGCAVLFSGTADVSAFSENEQQFIEELKQISDIKLPENFGETCEDEKMLTHNITRGEMAGLIYELKDFVKVMINEFVGEEQ